MRVSLGFALSVLTLVPSIARALAISPPTPPPSPPLLDVADPGSLPSSLLDSLQASRFKNGFANRVLLIRHGEKPGHGKEGLNKKGQKRAQCLRKVLGGESSHNIGLIIAQSFNPNTGMRKRPYDTVLPLANDLGLPVVTDCDRDDPECVVRLVSQFAKHSRKDVLICWKHSFLHGLAQALGSHARLEYPDDRFDIMWIVQNRKIVSKKSERCHGLDSRRRRDPDLEVEDEELAKGTVEIKNEINDNEISNDQNFDLDLDSPLGLSSIDGEAQQLSFDLSFD